MLLADELKTLRRSGALPRARRARGGRASGAESAREFMPCCCRASHGQMQDKVSGTHGVASSRQEKIFSIRVLRGESENLSGCDDSSMDALRCAPGAMPGARLQGIDKQGLSMSGTRFAEACLACSVRTAPRLKEKTCSTSPIFSTRPPKTPRAAAMSVPRLVLRPAQRRPAQRRRAR